MTTVDPTAEPESTEWLVELVRISAAIARSDWDAAEAGFHRLGAGNCAPDIVDEMILQLYLFVGFPAALTAAGIWQRSRGQAATETDPLAEPDRLEEWVARGVSVCRTVYGSAYDGLRANVAAIHPALDRWMVVEGYGKVLGRPGLELWQRELCIVALLAAGVWEGQLHSHLRGALLAGASVESVTDALEIGLERVGPSDQERLRGLWTRVLDSQRRGQDVH